jgi:gliding motility-associated-like protein
MCETNFLLIQPVAISKHLKRILISLIMMLCTSWEMYAEHIIGGEIYYAYQGNNVYTITMRVYKDCANSETPFDANAVVGIFETSTGNYYDDISIALINSNVELVPTQSNDPCNILPPNLCIERATYTANVTLPPLAGGYTIAYQRCCRVAGITNLAFDLQGTTLVANIPDTDALGEFNSSAVFTELPPVTICINSDFYFDQSAQDPDGDVLVYSLCDPLRGGTNTDPAPNPPSGPPYNPVAWAAGFNATTPIPGSPSISIDPQTGIISGIPTDLGIFVIGICVSEYRNGVLINTVSRDFQYRIIACASAVSEFPTMENSTYDVCSDLTVNFTNLAPNGSNATYLWDFGVPGTLTDTSNDPEPTFTFPEPGIYNITLTTNPGLDCQDESSHLYTVYPAVVPTILPTTIDTYNCIDLQDTYDFVVTGNFSNAANISWSFGSGAEPQTSQQDNPFDIVFPANAPQWTVSVEVEENGCVGTDNQTIINQPNPIASIAQQNVFCSGLEYTFTSNSTGAASQEWNFAGNGTANLANLSSPTFVYSNAGTYDVQLYVTAPQACSDTATATFEITDLPAPFFDRPPSQCLEDNSFDFEAQGNITNFAGYQWNFGPSASVATSAVANPSGISFETADVHPITLTITENGCAVSYTDSVAVAQHILPYFDVETTSGCPGHVANVVVVTESVVPVFYIWDFGNGSSSSQGITTHTYELPGSYSITATAFTNEGCYDNLIITFPNAVTIYPNPDPGFSVTPQVMDITNAVCEISSVYQEGDCDFYMTDGGFLDDCNSEYSWVESGVQTITHYVTSPQGCTSSATGEVLIQGFTFYAPASFTPNNDGINDFWFPVTTGVSSMEMRVYNRWGDLVYQTNDKEGRWSGQVEEGNYFIPNGIYHYRIIIRDLILQKHEFSGSFSVFR